MHINESKSSYYKIRILMFDIESYIKPGLDKKTKKPNFNLVWEKIADFLELMNENEQKKS